MKADITRKTFDPARHFSRVLMQQGRVQLDADWNEQAAIHHHYLRRLAADLIGPCGGPHDNLGFSIAALGAAAAPQTADFALRWGHYYVDGVLCEVEATPVPVTSFPDKANKKIAVALWTVDGTSFEAGQYIALSDGDLEPGSSSPDTPLLRIVDVDYDHSTLTVHTDISAFVNAKPKQPLVRRITTYLNQPDFAPPSLQQGAYHVYLDVWERLITYVENDSIREVALNGPDTAARAKVVWQVKLLKSDAAATAQPTCLTPQGLNALLQPPNLARLKARAQPSQASDDPCTIAPDALYRGPENQCYRVEIHTGSVDEDGKPLQPTFKWSRENGDVVFPIRGGGGTNALTLETLGRDDRFGLREGDWVEVQDDDSVLANRVSPLLRVQSIDRSRLTVVLAGDADADVGKDPSKHPLLRRWDQKEGDPTTSGLTLGPDRAAQVPSDNSGSNAWLDLEDGVQVKFTDPAKTLYRPGDYWLIPARVATGDAEWPSETVLTDQGKVVTERLALPPMGVKHHYAPLALLTVGADYSVSISTCLSEFFALATRVVEEEWDVVAAPSTKPKAAVQTKSTRVAPTVAKTDT